MRVAATEHAAGDNQKAVFHRGLHKLASRAVGRLRKRIKRAIGSDKLVTIRQGADDGVPLSPIFRHLSRRLDIERRHAGFFRNCQVRKYK